jgi:hypothetical protein
MMKGKPACNRPPPEGLKEACLAAGIDPVSRITGHKSRAVFEEYADHIITENLEAAVAAGAEVFGNIINFRKGA